MAVDIDWLFQIVFLYLKFIIDAFVIVKRMGIFGPGRNLQLDA